MLDLPDYKVRRMTELDLERVLEWRNHPEVRRYMYTQQVILLEEHERWFKTASCDDKRHLLIFEKIEEPLGFINIHEIKNGGIADWGFYLSPDAPKGTGQVLGRTALDYAFQSASVHKICGQALAFNQRSIAFHLKLGFEQEGILRHQHFDGQNYHDVVCFGLLVDDWHKKIERN